MGFFYKNIRVLDVIWSFPVVLSSPKLLSTSNFSRSQDTYPPFVRMKLVASLSRFSRENIMLDLKETHEHSSTSVTLFHVSPSPLKVGVHSRFDCYSSVTTDTIVIIIDENNEIFPNDFQFKSISGSGAVTNVRNNIEFLLKPAEVLETFPEEFIHPLLLLLRFMSEFRTGLNSNNFEC